MINDFIPREDKIILMENVIRAQKEKIDKQAKEITSLQRIYKTNVELTSIYDAFKFLIKVISKKIW